MLINFPVSQITFLNILILKLANGSFTFSKIRIYQLSSTLSNSKRLLVYIFSFNYAFTLHSDYCMLCKSSWRRDLIQSTVSLLPLIWILALSSICKWLERRKLVAMRCDQSWCHNLVPDLKVKLKVKLVVGGCLGALEQDTPPPRSVLRIILKDPDFFDTVRKTSSSCPLFMILREKDGVGETEESLLFTENFFHSLKQSSILHIPGWERQLRYPSLRKNRIFGAVSKVGGREACSKSHKGPRIEKLIAQSESLANRGAEDKLRRFFGALVSGCPQVKPCLWSANIAFQWGGRKQGEGRVIKMLFVYLEGAKPVSRHRCCLL